MLFGYLTLFLIAATSLAEAAKGCRTKDGKEVGVGVQYDVPGKCRLNRCKANNWWDTAACRRLRVPQGWSATIEDTSEGAKYPTCCSQLVAPLNVVPDILRSLPGTRFVDIRFGDTVAVKVGNELTPTQVKDEPQVRFACWANPKSYYLLIMADPDSLSQDPDAREFLHWMVGNIPGGNVKSGDVIAEYIGSGPSRGSGFHRYFFLLFKQPGKLTFDETKIDKFTVGWRRGFSSRKFAEKHGLGSPEAINVYRAQYDDYVPEVHRQIGYVAPASTD